MARLPDFAQGVVAFDVGLRLGGERQSIGRLHDQIERRFDAVLDVGCGETPLTRLIAEVPIATTLEEGVRVVVVHVVGPDLADLDYLDRFEQDDLFAPEATLIVMNGGLVLTRRSLNHAFRQVTAHKTIMRALGKGRGSSTCPVSRA